MGLTKAKKDRREKIRKFQKEHGIERCVRCGAKLYNSDHPFQCKACLKITKNFPTFDRPRLKYFDTKPYPHFD